MRLSQRSGVPLHYQLSQQLEHSINAGGFPSGEPLPTEESLSKDLRVARGTVRRAMSDLVRRGLLYRVPGRGTFVRQGAAVGHQVLMLSPMGRDGAMHPDEELFLRLRMSLMESGDTAVLKPLSIDTVEWMAYASEIAGAFVFGADATHEEVLRRLASLSIPSVVLSANTVDIPLACVDVDNAGAVRMAVDYLRSLGHRRIGHIGALPDAFDSRERFDAFDRIMREAGLDGMREMIPADLDWKRGTAAVLKSWRGPGFPTAILAGGFGISLYALSELGAMKMSVPGDVSLIGFDDNPAAPLFAPPLTVLRQPGEEMTRQALDLLVTGIKNPQQWRPEKKLLPATLIERLSCASLERAHGKIGGLRDMNALPTMARSRKR